MPTFTKPFNELVAEDLADLLETVTTANGYRVDVASVERQNRPGNVPADNKIYLLQEPDSQVEDPAHAHEEWYQPFAIWYFAIEPDLSTIPIDLRLNLGASDIWQIITTTFDAGGYTRSSGQGGFLNVKLLKPGYIQDETGQTVGIIVNIECHLRTLYGNRYQTS